MGSHDICNCNNAYEAAMQFCRQTYPTLQLNSGIIVSIFEAGMNYQKQTKDEKKYSVKDIEEIYGIHVRTYWHDSYCEDDRKKIRDAISKFNVGQTPDQQNRKK